MGRSWRSTMAGSIRDAETRGVGRRDSTSASRRQARRVAGPPTAACRSPSPKPFRLIGMPMPSSGVWKMMKVAVWPVRSCLSSLSSIMHLGDAAVRQAAHEAGAADVGLVDLQPEAGRQQHAERRQHAHQPALLVGGLQHDHGEADIGAVLGGDALDQGALLALRAGRRVAADLPVAVDRLHRALRRAAGAAPATSAASAPQRKPRPAQAVPRISRTHGRIHVSLRARRPARDRAEPNRRSPAVSCSQPAYMLRQPCQERGRAAGDCAEITAAKSGAFAAIAAAPAGSRRK